MVLSVCKKFLYIRTEDLKVVRYPLDKKNPLCDLTYTFENNFADLVQYDIERFGYEIVGLTEEGSFQLLNKKKKTKLVDVLKRDEEIFYSFGVTVDENYLVLEGIEIDSVETDVKIPKSKSNKRKKKGKKAAPSDDEYEMEHTNKHVLYVWECGMDGEFSLKSQIDFDSLHAEHDFLTNIWCV